MDEVGLKTQPRVSGEVRSRLCCTWGWLQYSIPGGRIHPLYGQGGSQGWTRGHWWGLFFGFWQGPFLFMLYLRAMLEHGIPGGRFHPLYGQGGSQDSTLGFWLGPFLTMLTWGWLQYCIPGGNIHPIYGRGGFQYSSRGYWRGPLLIMLYQGLALAL